MKKIYIIAPIVMSLCATRMPDKKPEPISAEQLLEHIHHLQNTPGYRLLHLDHQKDVEHVHKKLTVARAHHATKLSQNKLGALHKKIMHHQETVKKLKESHRNPVVDRFLKQMDSIEKSGNKHKITKNLKKDLADMRTTIEKHLKDDALPIDFIPETQRKLRSLTKRVHASFIHKAAAHTAHHGYIPDKSDK